MCRAGIYDRLNEKHIYTKKVNTEDEAKTESKETIKRLSKKFKCDTTRFYLDFIECL